MNAWAKANTPKSAPQNPDPGLPPWDDLYVERMTLSEQLHAEGWLTHSEAGGSEEEHGDDYFRTDTTDPAA